MINFMKRCTEDDQKNNILHYVVVGLVEIVFINMIAEINLWPTFKKEEIVDKNYLLK